jgi:hypothetical protein
VVGVAMLIIFDTTSKQKLVDFLSNAILLCVVLLCWFYVLYAGRVVTERYLEKVDFSEVVERISVIQLRELPSNNTF